LRRSCILQKFYKSVLRSITVSLHRCTLQDTLIVGFPGHLAARRNRDGDAMPRSSGRILMNRRYRAAVITSPSWEPVIDTTIGA